MERLTESNGNLIRFHSTYLVWWSILIDYRCDQKFSLTLSQFDSTFQCMVVALNCLHLNKLLDFQSIINCELINWSISILKSQL